MIDLTPIANAIISLAALLITTFLIPWIKANSVEADGGKPCKTKPHTDDRIQVISMWF